MSEKEQNRVPSPGSVFLGEYNREIKLHMIFDGWSPFCLFEWLDTGVFFTASLFDSLDILFVPHQKG